jgi:predicted metal-dependent hydrolase
MRRVVTAVRHNARVTLFDLLDEDDFDEGGFGDEGFDDEEFRLVGPFGSSTCEELEERYADTAPTEKEPDWPEVEVRVSSRRKKTSEATWVGGRIVVSLPAHLSAEARQQTVTWLVERLVSKHRHRSAVSDDQLMARALKLAERYKTGARPVSVRWVTNQSTRWGSCSFHSREIRLSHRLRSVPEWVLDSVLVHELAHLIHPNHSAAFHRLADAYPRHHEAGIFLAGYGLGLANPDA